MEDQIIGVVFIIIVFAIVGISSYKSKRRFGENPSGAKYSKARR